MMSNFWSGGEENIALEINRSPVVIMTLKGKDKELRACLTVSRRMQGGNNACVDLLQMMKCIHWPCSLSQ